MGGGVRLAIAILVLFLAMVAFFFAFHPAGVANGTINNPVEILKWMFNQYDQTVSGASSPANTPASAGQQLPSGSDLGGTIPSGGNHGVHLSEQA